MFPSLICKFSSLISSKTHGFIICQCIVLYATFVISCPPGKSKDEPYPPNPREVGGAESTTPDTTTEQEGTDPVSEKVEGDMKIVKFNVQPERPNTTEHAWVMICKEGSMKFDQCCISNDLWQLDHLPRQKRKLLPITAPFMCAIRGMTSHLPISY